MADMLAELVPVTPKQQDNRSIATTQERSTTRRRDIFSTTSCTCMAYHQTVDTELLPFLYFRKVFYRNHYRQCPKSQNSETNLELIMRIIPPKWLLSHAVNLSFSLRRRASYKNCSISPLIFGTSRLVDPAESPAFRAIRHTFDRAIIDTVDTIDRQFDRDHSLPAHHIRELEKVLRELFQSHQASALDESKGGNTLLYVSTRVL
jgi:hypothetical protein